MIGEVSTGRSIVFVYSLKIEATKFIKMYLPYVKTLRGNHFICLGNLLNIYQVCLKRTTGFKFHHNECHIVKQWSNEIS